MTKTENSRIYLLLTCSGTVLSGAISLFTGDSYTHVSLAFDPALESLCSFARRNHAFPLPAGLVQESLDGGYFSRHSEMPCALYALPVSRAAYKRARQKVEKMLENQMDYHYSIKGLALCRLGIEEEREGHYFCSQFVGEVLEDSGACALPKPPSLMRPQDYAALPQGQCLYKGSLYRLTELSRGEKSA